MSDKLLHNDWIYNLPDGQKVLAVEIESEYWILWVMTDDGRLIDGDRGLEVTRSGIVLDGLQEVCKVTDLIETGSFHVVDTGEILPTSADYRVFPKRSSRPADTGDY